MEKMSCVKCGLVEEVSYVKVKINYRPKQHAGPTLRVIHENKIGFFWVNCICPNCRRKRFRELRGITKTVSDIKEPRMLRCFESEDVAAKFFESLGFSVRKGSGRGPDLFCTLGDWEYMVEVKLASQNTGSWRVGKVTKRTQRCDLVAFVLPNKRVYIDDMQMHLASKQVRKDGSRNITSIVKEFGLDPLPQS